MDPEADLSHPLPPPPSQARLLHRRRVLGILGGAGIGLAALPAADQLRPWLQRIPWREIAQRAGKNRPNSSSSRPIILVDKEGYGAYLQSKNLRHVTIGKILAAHAKERSGVKNHYPPPSLWTGLLPTLKVVDLLADYLQEDVKAVVSAYRSPAYNAMCPGSATQSQHIKNNALDLVFKSKPETVANAARELRSRGLFKGGVGLYSSFTHIDTRGSNQDW